MKRKNFNPHKITNTGWADNLIGITYKHVDNDNIFLFGKKGSPLRRKVMHVMPRGVRGKK